MPHALPIIRPVSRFVLAGLALALSSACTSEPVDDGRDPLNFDGGSLDDGPDLAADVEELEDVVSPPDAPRTDVDSDVDPDVDPEDVDLPPEDVGVDTVDQGGDPLDGLSDVALIAAVHDMVDGQRELSYNAAREFMFVTQQIDVVDGVIECVYTGSTVTPDGTRTPGNMNTEHSWPQSDGADVEPMKSDIHHLFPVTADANGARGSLPYGNTGCSGSSCEWEDGGSSMDAGVFEVRPLRRGDIARAHFYFSVRYNMHIDADEEAVLRAWHQEDPPDDHERERNDRIERVQLNRNLFVDRPELVDRISDF